MASPKNKKETAIIHQNRNKIIFIGSVLGAIVIFSAVYFVLYKKDGISFDASSGGEKPKVINENLVIPDTKEISGNSGKVLEKGTMEIALSPKNDGEKVVVSKAVLTVIGAYELAKSEAQLWSSEAKLVFIKSLGAITLEGKSSQWQLVFSSDDKKGRGYEIIIQGGQIVSKKEVDSQNSGGDVPVVWKDLGEVIKELQSHPVYQDTTFSAVSFALNPDNNKWYYNLSTSKGMSAIVVE
ncbi:MAG: hypothetical protein Q8Q21_00515 [bacterium]|nr:hypothetical protein [bacterium]